MYWYSLRDQVLPEDALPEELLRSNYAVSGGVCGASVLMKKECEHE
jgi:hypothetical protein